MGDKRQGCWKESIGTEVRLLQAVEGSEVKFKKVACADGQGRASEVSEWGGLVPETYFRTITLIGEPVETS